LLELHDITKSFDGGTVVLNGVNLKVKQGEFVVLLGPSGSGKTTLIRCISGLVEPDIGTIKFEEKHTSDTSKKNLQNRLGVVFQDFNLIENLSSLNNVLCGLLSTSNKFLSLLYLFSTKEKLEALDCLNRVGLLDKSHVRVSMLSGGQKQRVGIARAMVKKPGLLLADEPVASLDPVISSTIMKLLREISKEFGIAVVCSLHQVDLALEFSDRIIGLANGEIVMNEQTKNIDQAKIQEIYSGQTNGLTFGPMMKVSDEE
jgi:phosphonate transport system ATP-binding protein